jgi:hypothetical protein
MKNRERRIFGAALGWLVVVTVCACGVNQSPACEQYVACQTYYEEEFEKLNPRNTNRYQPDGVCWENDELAEECTQSCLAATQALLDTLTFEEREPGPCAL